VKNDLNNKKRIHIAIFELVTEEESVLTLYRIFKKCGYTVSLFLSNRIWSLIKEYVNVDYLEELIVFQDNETFKDVSGRIIGSINNHKIDITIIPRFQANNINEVFKYIKFFKNYNVIVGIFNYTRWFAYIPPIRFNGWKIIKRSLIRDWLYCHLVFKYISAYFVSEIHRDSENPLKKIINKRTKKKVFDFPFKTSNTFYNPDFEYEYPIFVIPGKIDKERRDYFLILKMFENKEIINLKWKLILLGRPDGRYGKLVIEKSRSINDLIGKKKIIYFDKYISRYRFEGNILSSTHILAPIVKSGYKMGKDSGAIYDVFKYNKIGIFNNSYFYDKDLLDAKAVIRYKDNEELVNIFIKIIKKEYNYSEIKMYFRDVNKYLSLKIYIDYFKQSIISYLS